MLVLESESKIFFRIEAIPKSKVGDIEVFLAYMLCNFGYPSLTNIICRRELCNLTKNTQEMIL